MIAARFLQGAKLKILGLQENKIGDIGAQTIGKYVTPRNLIII